MYVCVYVCVYARAYKNKLIWPVNERKQECVTTNLLDDPLPFKIIYSNNFGAHDFKW